MAERLKMAVIGVGRLGLIHARNLAFRIPAAELVAVADVNLEAARLAAAETGMERYTSDYRELLDDRAIQAVAIVSSTDTHALVIADAAAAGKEIFCEKPIARTLEQTDAAIAAVTAAGVRLQIGFMRRFDPPYVAAKRRIEAGEIGEVELIKATSRDQRPASRAFVETSGGMFRDLSIHDFDLVRFLTGSEVVEMQVMGATLVAPMFRELEDPDTAVINLRFANGALGNIDNSRRAIYGYDIRTEVMGSRGSLRMGYEAEVPIVALTEQGVTHDHVQGFPQRFELAYLNEMREFVDCILCGGTPAVGGDDARRALELAEAATTSYRERRPVTLGAR